MAAINREESFNDLRKLKRRHLIYYLEVFDETTGDLLGHLVDLTTEGIKLVSREPIAPGRTFTLKMLMPEEAVGVAQVVFSATSMWSRPDVNPAFHATGFSAPDLDEDTKALFIRLIELVGFND